MKNMSSSELDAKSKMMTDQLKYARDSAFRAKEEGNRLFRAGKNAEVVHSPTPLTPPQAVEKYTRAAEALKMDTTVEVRSSPALRRS